MKRLLPIVLLVLAACSGNLEHEGPFDPNSPLDKQAKGEVSGVIALSGESDAAGVNVQLQSSARTYDVDTGADGAFRLTGVVPGTYQLRIGTRYFEEENGSLTVALGEALDLGTRTLMPRRADVIGSATVEALVDGATETSGGARLTLTKTGSVRSAAAAPFAAAAFRAYAAVVTQTHSTTADGNGDFRFDDVEAGVYELTVETPGAATVTVGNVKVTGEDGDVAVEPVTTQRVSGTFAIDAMLADGVTASNVYSGSTNVGLTFTQLAAATIELGESADGSAAGCTGWASIPAAVSATRALGGEGRRYVCARFIDAGGNKSETVVKSIFVDTVAPTGSLSVNGGAAFATQTFGVLTLTTNDAGSGTTSVRLAQAVGNTCPAPGSVEAFTSTKSLTFAAADGAEVTVCALFADAAGNWMAAPVSDSIVVDTDGPTAPAVTINAFAPYATSQIVTLSLAASGATQMRIVNGTATSSGAWEPFRASASWSLPTGIGTKTVTVDFRDEAGNVSLTAADTIEFDDEAPASPSISVTNANAGGYVNTAVAQLGLFAVGAANMQISRDGFFDTEPVVTYATAATAYLAGGDGTKTLFARFIDLAGNTSAVATVGAVLDTGAPTGTLSINDAAAYATVAGTGSLTLAASDSLSGVSQVKVAELGASPTCAAALAVASPEAYTSTRAQPIAAANGATLTVCALFGDAAGNWMAAPVSDSIVVDTVAPSAVSVSINGAATYSTSQTVTLTLSATGATQMRIANGSSTSGASWEPYRPSAAWSLGSGTGVKEVTVDFRDDAGNVSAAAADTIEVDTDAPASPSLTVTNATAGGFVNTAVAQLGLFAVGAAKMQISRDGFFDTEPLVAYATAATAYLAGADGTKAIYARFIDAAGNASAVATANVVLDTGKPTGTISLNDAAAYATVAGAGSLTLAAVDGGSGVDQVKVAELGVAPDCDAALASALPEAYTSTRAQTISAADGVTLTVCALFGDAAGNWMASPVSDSIVVDTVAPSSPSVDIDSGATYATSQFVTLTLNAVGATEMRLANGSSPASAAWEPFRTSVAWFLPNTVGLKEVAVQFRDAAGNTSLTAADTITLDNEAPASPALTVTNANAAGYVTSATAQLSLFAVGATAMQLSRDGFFDIEPLDTYAASATMYLSGGDGVKLLYVRYLDAAGNASAIAAASVVLDTQLPETGFMRIDGGAAWTTDTGVEISFTATGADEVAIGQGSCPATGWQAYATQIAHTLTGPDLPAITLYARFRDAAGNTTACISDAIGMDQVLQAPLFAAAVTGEEGVPTKTAKLFAWVTLTGLTLDVYEMQIDDDSAFGGAAWRPVTSKFVVPLTKGDGTKTAYVRIRDRAGNTSVESSPWIELDQTGPESPSLVVTDHTGDGFAATENDVELVWSKPTDAFSYSLERFVLGVDGYFSVIAAIPDGAPKYTDDVTATVGRTHLYRMRALDELGNLSNYSVAVAAYPFAPLRRVFKANTSQGLRYFFKPNPGTNSLRPTYTYNKLDNDLVTTALVENTVEWIRPLPAADVFEESLTLRASNQDGSLVYDTVVPLEMNLREKLTYSNRGWQQRMAVDVTGVAHLVVSNFDGLTYATNSNGTWDYMNWSWPGSERFPSVAVDGSGNPHIAFLGNQQPLYKTRVNGVWSEEVIDTATNTGAYTDIAVDRNGVVNVVYYDATKQDLKFARRAAGWVTQAVDTAGDVGQYARVALDAAGKAHVVYYDQTSQALKYATNRSGPWSTATLDTGVNGWSLVWYAPPQSGGAGIAIGRDDQPRVAYVKGTSVMVQTYDQFLGWQSETIVPVMQAAFAAIAMDRAGNPAVAYFDNTTYDLHLARKLGGSWTFRPVHTAADPGRFVSIASDGFGDLHLAYGEDGALAGYMRLVEPRLPATIDTAGDPGFGGAAAVGPRDAVFMADWNRTSRQLVFRTNKNGPWETEVVTTSTQIPADSNRVRLTVRSTGQVHLVYKDPDVDGLRWWRRTVAGAWSTGFIESGMSVGDFPMLAMASDGTVWATYRAYNGLGDWDIKYSTRIGNNPWTAPQIIETIPNSSYVNPIGFKPDGTVVVLSGHSGNWWEKGPLASTFTQNTTDYGGIYDSDFVFDASGKVHAASRQPSQDKLVYSTNKSGSWVSEVVSETGLPATDTQIQLDPEGKVHIVYYDVEYQAVRYATNATGGWVVVTLDAGPKVGLYLSAFVDSRNHAQVFYYDEINGALKNLYDFSGWIQPTSVSLSTQF